VSMAKLIADAYPFLRQEAQQACLQDLIEQEYFR
jgi:hypothetical protein